MHGGGGDMDSHVDINACTDAYTDPNQAVGPKVGCLQCTQCHTGKHMLPCNHA